MAIIATIDVIIRVLLALTALSLVLMGIGLWQEFGPRPSKVPRWQRRLWAEWRKHPLAAPRCDIVIRTGRLW